MIRWLLYTQAGNQIDDWEAEGAPHVGERIWATVDDGPPAVYRVDDVEHRLHLLLRGDSAPRYTHALRTTVRAISDEAIRLCAQANEG